LPRVPKMLGKECCKLVKAVHTAISNHQG
jgi:hypothetical protein